MAPNVYNFGTWVEKCQIMQYAIEHNKRIKNATNGCESVTTFKESSICLYI